MPNDSAVGGVMLVFLMVMLVLVLAAACHALVIASPVILVAWLVGRAVDRGRVAAANDSVIERAVMKEVTSRADD